MHTLIWRRLLGAVGRARELAAVSAEYLVAAGAGSRNVSR